MDPWIHGSAAGAAARAAAGAAGDGINFASKINGHALAFQHVVLLCWLSVCHADSWRVFLCTPPPAPPDFNVVASSVHPLAKLILRKGWRGAKHQRRKQH